MPTLSAFRRTLCKIMFIVFGGKSGPLYSTDNFGSFDPAGYRAG